MARPIYQYRPVNDNPDQAIGVLLPLNKGAHGRAVTNHYASGSSTGRGVFVSSYTTYDQAISNLKNLILTEKGERYMQPNFGTNIRTILFDNNTEEIRSKLLSTVKEDIEHWLPYIELKDVLAGLSEDMHSLTVKLFFKITSIGANVVINILASENDFQVSSEEASVELVQTGTFGADTAFAAGDGGTY